MHHRPRRAGDGVGEQAHPWAFAGITHSVPSTNIPMNHSFATSCES
jgi:hypothetical protein